MTERFFSNDETTEYESDASLRRVYGDHAVFQRVGAFTLVHLDSPSDDLLARREAEFDPDEYFFDDCPLCEHARASGGHIVFDHIDDESGDETLAGLDAPASARAESTPAASREFDAALGELAACAVAFDDAAKTRVPEWLADRIGFDVLILHDTIASTLWEHETRTIVEPIEQQIGRAFTTVAAARQEAPELDDVARPLEAALKRVVSAWRAL